MGYMTEGYKILFKGIADWIVRNRAHIGTGVSIGGTIVSNVLSTRAGAKSGRMIDAKSQELARPLTTKEKVELCWKNHVGSAATAGVACVGAAYSDNQHVKDFNKAMTAYTGIKKLYDTTRRATKEVLGEKKEMELQDKINQKTIANDPEFKKKVAAMPPNPDPEHMQRFYEPSSGELIWASMDKVKNAIQMMKLEMSALHKRETNNNFSYRGRYGIKLVRFFDLVDWDLPEEKYGSRILQDYGFNKGSYENGQDDDDIGATFTPMSVLDDTATAFCINWITPPSDMQYGDYLKS